MADTVTQSPALLQPNPDSPVSDQVKGSPESTGDTSQPEKWPFSAPPPIREDQIRNAVSFLSHPSVRGTPMVQRFSFLERKGLTREEIEEAFRRCPDPPTSEGTKSLVRTEGGVPAWAPQAQPGGYHQAVVSTQPQPVHQYASGPIVQARPGSNWSQLILGASFIAAAGVGTGYFFQKVLAPKVRTWLRDTILEEKKPKPIESKGPTLTPLEEAVIAAAAAASAAAAAAAEVAKNSQEVLKLQAEEWQHFRSSMKNLDSKTEELKGTLTLMSKTLQDSREHVIPSVPVHAEDANNYRATVKTYQRTLPPAEQVQMKQGVQVVQSVNGVDKIHSNGHSTSISNYASPQSEDEPWWRRKKVEVDTHASPKKPLEGTLPISEVEADLDREIGSTGSRASMLNRGVSLGRQGWVPPPVPRTVMPGAASAIRYQKPATVDEAKQTFFSEEKEVLRDSSSSIRLQNPVKIDEPKVVAEDAAKVDEAKPGVTAEEKPPSGWYQRHATMENGAFVSEEDVSSHQPQPLAQAGLADFSSLLRLQNSVEAGDVNPKVGENPALSAEANLRVLAEEREITAQTTIEPLKVSELTEIKPHKMPEGPSMLFEQPRVSDKAEITSNAEITSQITFEPMKVSEITEVTYEPPKTPAVFEQPKMSDKAEIISNGKEVASSSIEPEGAPMLFEQPRISDKAEVTSNAEMTSQITFEPMKVSEITEVTYEPPKTPDVFEQPKMSDKAEIISNDKEVASSSIEDFPRDV